MNKHVYLNGEYLEASQAKVSIFDRGLLFGDGVYEVAGVMDGKLISFENHMQRLMRSLNAISITPPLSEEEILQAYRTLVDKNQIVQGLVYMQVTRGEADRDFVWEEGMKPTVFMFTQHKPDIEDKVATMGVALKSVEDIRWARRDIKSVNLLGQVLAKQQAKEAGAYEALMVDKEGFITECGATSFFIIKGRRILTRPLSNEILPGVTRRSVLALCEKHQVELQERLVRLEEVYDADEAFITGASTYVLPVTEIDGKKIGNGLPGALALELRKIYMNYARSTAI